MIIRKIEKTFFIFFNSFFLNSFIDFKPAKAFDTGAYRYCVYFGLKETLFVYLEAGYIENFWVKNLLKTYRKNFAQNKYFDSRSFKDSVLIPIVTYLFCRLCKYL